MIKDAHLRLIFIPLLGVSLPVLSGSITYARYSVYEIILANLFFIITSLFIWTGSNWLHGKIRSIYAPYSNPFYKIATVCFSEALYGASVGGLAVFCWLKFSRESFQWIAVYKFVSVCVLAVIIFSLIYEILFLSKERELDNRIVLQLDRERTQAELQALTNELDPHFIFNSLNTLNHLITTNPEQAHLFNNKLAQVYKYFLINRVRELISLEDELEFINSYFYLLQIRHEGKLQLTIELNPESRNTKIPPCALQILVENAIKHNEFSETNPLHIRVAINSHFLKVTNNIKPKPYSVTSTGIGLKNLSSRYKIICRRDIVIESNRETYTVKLPLIK